MANANLPPLCAKGCGFYSSLQAKNLCSKCYNDFLKELIAKSTAEVKVDPSSAAPNPSVSVDSSSVPTPSKLKNRCESCNKKVGLMGFSCRCGKVLCGVHRYPKEHSCNFDFKTADRLILAEENSLVMADKLESRI
ncbi:PREDICTED: putative zinc finger A20 and AN1 domain-containing stress-associated protein 8 isoform X2 [Theobroma cacao]|uniref:Zinc finger A20 and AN1 domain-containing stress-associated protein 8 isoform X2 n=1 Tax=Theobroma cacao TaxID=3641 RepID=A0AB32V5U9_THECC|nr:PREDICTED: putative zinc finger A20 and AN1 domain-containing stress-associated protein 8 isoform X2 [Theobroma cacao]